VTRAERVCAKLPTWMLRAIIASPARRSWWAAAYLEIWRREVADVVQAEADEESGPWPVVAPRGVQ
jgi:hypothetical protein